MLDTKGKYCFILYYVPFKHNSTLVEHLSRESFHSLPEVLPLVFGAVFSNDVRCARDVSNKFIPRFRVLPSGDALGGGGVGGGNMPKNGSIKG